ncbi:MAG: sulfatase-like hydrolase/transferase [Bryobacterales bacterium]|nr:sulfatase-like hydrolase/transferase [Bryobacterales bacterium]
MRRRTFLAGFGASPAAARQRRPNVLFLFTDDQRTDTIAALGNRHIVTPHLDGLARSSLVFNNAYCMGSNSPAVCLPSRNMLLSGRAYFRFEKYASGSDANFADSMKEAGYFTYHHGKLGNTAREIHKRFDSSRYLKDEEDRRSGEPGREIVDSAIEFLRSRRQDRPFFLYLAFANPHDPRVAARRYLDLYRPERIPLPRNFLPEHPFDNGELKVRDEQLAAWPRTADEIRKHLRDYYAVMTGLDFHIGRLLRELRERGLYEDTIIIYSGDNGLALGSHGLMGKQSLYEHSMKVPLMFSGPGIRRGRTDALVYLLDIYPTVMELVGGRMPPGLDGISLQPVIQGRARGVRDSLFTAYRDVQRAVRDERWKLIRYPKIGKTQLFDLRGDPDETRDLASDPGQADRIRRMTALMEKWRRRVGDL